MDYYTLGQIYPKKPAVLQRFTAGINMNFGFMLHLSPLAMDVLSVWLLWLLEMVVGGA